MAFEPLRTDEKLAAPVKTRDFDAIMLAGCTGFVFASLLIYALGIWPFFAFPDLFLTTRFLTALGVSIGQVLVVGLIFTRKSGLPGACGTIGGSLALAIFLHLTLEQLMLGNLYIEIPNPEYPEYTVWAAPLAYWLLVTVICAFAIPRAEFRDEPQGPTDR